jgi:peptidoglycan-associated lipoprotein
MKALQRLALLVPLAACSNPPPPVAPAAPPTPVAAAAAPAAKPADNPGPTEIYVADSIRKACGITDTEAHFAYDSAQLRAADSPVIQKLAQCFTSGPLTGRSMSLVGHADPRGEAEYNLALGGHRADSVKSAMISARLDESKIITTSRGELDASGSDEPGWQKDRRVDVQLVN